VSEITGMRRENIAQVEKYFFFFRALRQPRWRSRIGVLSALDWDSAGSRGLMGSRRRRVIRHDIVEAYDRAHRTLWPRAIPSFSS